MRRALEEPAPRAQRAALFLDLGIAEASAGLDGWDDHLRGAMEAAPNARAAAVPAQVLANALNRAQRFDEAMDVLDRAAAALHPADGELALELEAAAVIVGMNRLVVSPSLAVRGKALRDRAREDPAAPVDVLATAAYTSVLENEPADAGAELALLAAARMNAGARNGLTSSAGLVARISMALLLAERYGELVPLLDTAIAQARATGDSALLAVALANRGAARAGGARARAILRRTAHAGLGGTRGRRRRRRQPRSIAAPLGDRLARPRRGKAGPRACARRSRRAPPTTKPADGGAGAPPRGARHRAPLRGTRSCSASRDRASRNRRAPAPSDSFRSRRAHRQ